MKIENDIEDKEKIGDKFINDVPTEAFQTLKEALCLSLI